MRPMATRTSAMAMAVPADTSHSANATWALKRAGVTGFRAGEGSRADDLSGNAARRAPDDDEGTAGVPARV